MSRVRLLTTKFEILKMLDDKSLFEFNVHLLDIANETFALDIFNIKVSELMGSLLTFEMTFDDKFEKKNKGISLQSTTSDQSDVKNKDYEDNLTDSIGLTKQFNTVMKHLDKQYENHVP